MKDSQLTGLPSGQMYMADLYIHPYVTHMDKKAEDFYTW